MRIFLTKEAGNGGGRGRSNIVIVTARRRKEDTSQHKTRVMHMQRTDDHKTYISTERI